MKNRAPIDLARLLDDHGIERRDGTTGEWINIACPFCYRGDGKFGMGWNGAGFSCFRCGKQRRGDVVAALLRISVPDALKTLDRYRGDITPGPGVLTRSRGVCHAKTGGLGVQLPWGSGPMGERHREYLRNRRFDPERLEREWGLLGTGPGRGPFALRIILPVVQGGRTVCYQGRDITGRASAKYKSCPDTVATVPIKDCLYGLDRVQGDTVVITEGAAKVWRLGPPAVATFGATVADTQLLLLNRFRRQIVLFDGDDAGRNNGERLVARLALFRDGVSFYRLPDGVGPDDLSDADAAALMRELIKQV